MSEAPISDEDRAAWVARAHAHLDGHEPIGEGWLEMFLALDARLTAAEAQYWRLHEAAKEAERAGAAEASRMTSRISELEHRWETLLQEKAASDAIIAATMAEIPVGYLPAHKPENMAAMVGDFVRRYAEQGSELEAAEAKLAEEEMDADRYCWLRDEAFAEKTKVEDHRDRLAAALRIAEGYVRLTDHEGRDEADLRESYPEAAAKVDADREAITAALAITTDAAKEQQ